MTRPPLSLRTSDLQALRNLIERLEDERPRAELEVFRAKHNPVKAGTRPQTFLSRFFATQEDPLGFLNLYKDDLGIMVGLVSGIMDDWFNWGEPRADGHAHRVGVILGKAKMPELRSRFVAAYDRHRQPYKARISLPGEDGMQAHLQGLVPRLRVALDRASNADGSTTMHFSFCCEDCGGYILFMPDDDDPDGPVLCKACEQVFGKRKDMEALARHIGARAIGNE